MNENQTPDTRHSHGTMRHDHPGGNLPHDHGNGGTDRAASVAFGVGTTMVVLGGLGTLAQQSNHTACNSTLVQVSNPQQCQTTSYLWTGAILMLVIGIVLIIVGAIMRAKS